MPFKRRSYTYPVLVEIDFAMAEEKILATLAGKENICRALKTFFERGEFSISDSTKPTLSDLVDVGLVSKRYASSSGGNVKAVIYRNKSGAPINVEGRVFENGEFIDY